MEIKDVKPCNFLFFRTVATIDQLKDHLPVGQRLYHEAVENNLWITGPIQWHYYNFSGDLSKKFDLEIALPIGELPPDYDGNFHIKRTGSFKCVSAVHKGSWLNIPDTYAAIFNFIAEKQLHPCNNTREVYVNVDFNDPEANFTEIQFGVR